MLDGVVVCGYFNFILIGFNTSSGSIERVILVLGVPEDAIVVWFIDDVVDANLGH